MKIREKSQSIQNFIVDNLRKHDADIAKVTADKFKISRAAVARHLSHLVKKKVLLAKGNTKARTYALSFSIDEKFGLSIAGLQEDIVWRERVSPLLSQIAPQNILTVCNYGFTEMLNNAIDHSESDTVYISIGVDAAAIYMVIRDFGIGVFRKLMRDFHLHDARHALLELSKGKLTTGAAGGHTGQGIFFTSRMFDEFSLTANGFSFCRFKEKDDWLFEEKQEERGTNIYLTISLRATHTANEIMSEYASELHDYGFTKTHVPLELARYEGEQLISRSQAKRLLLRVEQFKEVLLDFKGITTIGQAFADQIFRVFQKDHPNLLNLTANTNVEIANMIARAKQEVVIEPNPSLFDIFKDDSMA